MDKKDKKDKKKKDSGVSLLFALGPRERSFLLVLDLLGAGQERWSVGRPGECEVEIKPATGRALIARQRR